MHRNLECYVHESRQIGVVIEEMARVNINILGISELRWTGMVNLTQMTIYLLLWARIP